MADLIKTLRQIERSNSILRTFERDEEPAWPTGPAAPQCMNCGTPTTVNARYWCAACDRDGLCLDCRDRHVCKP